MPAAPKRFQAVTFRRSLLGACAILLLWPCIPSAAVEAAGRCLVFPENDCGDVCHGDCDGDGTVSIADLMSGVGDLVGDEIRCANVDRNGDGRVSVSELVGAVGFALDGCPAYPAVPNPGSVSFILSWLVYADAPDLVVPYSWPEPPVNQFTVYTQEIYEAEWRAQRRVSPGEVVTVAVDAYGDEVARWSEFDPRWVVFDCRDSNTSPLCGGEFWWSRSSLVVYLPYDPAIVELQLFEAHAPWGAVELAPLGRLAVSIE